MACRLVQGETEIKADRLGYVVDQDLVLFEGNVVVTEGEDQVNSGVVRPTTSTTARHATNRPR